jgi:DNA-binding transcriptional ArsR family regulator
MASFKPPRCHERHSRSARRARLASTDAPVRLRIVQELANQVDRPCGTFELPVAKATASHHFKVLREAGVIRVRCEGTHHLNSLRRACLDERFPGLLDAVLGATAGQGQQPLPIVAG